MLTQDLSGETLDVIRNYLRQFLDRKYSIDTSMAGYPFIYTIRRTYDGFASISLR